jgi:hypothetical protein
MGGGATPGGACSCPLSVAQVLVGGPAGRGWGFRREGRAPSRAPRARPGGWNDAGWAHRGSTPHRRGGGGCGSRLHAGCAGLARCGRRRRSCPLARGEPHPGQRGLGAHAARGCRPGTQESKSWPAHSRDGTTTLCLSIGKPHEPFALPPCFGKPHAASAPPRCAIESASLTPRLHRLVASASFTPRLRRLVAQLNRQASHSTPTAASCDTFAPLPPPPPRDNPGGGQRGGSHGLCAQRQQR